MNIPRRQFNFGILAALWPWGRKKPCDCDAVPGEWQVEIGDGDGTDCDGCCCNIIDELCTPEELWKAVDGAFAWQEARDAIVDFRLNRPITITNLPIPLDKPTVHQR